MKTVLAGWDINSNERLLEHIFINEDVYAFGLTANWIKNDVHHASFINIYIYICKVVFIKLPWYNRIKIFWDVLLLENNRLIDENNNTSPIQWW